MNIRLAPILNQIIQELGDIKIDLLPGLLDK
jgi:hypothetical protein